MLGVKLLTTLSHDFALQRRLFSNCSSRDERLLRRAANLIKISMDMNPIWGPKFCLTPGLVLIKNGLSNKEQIDLAQVIAKLGEDPEKGFWKTDTNGKKVLNSAPHQGRMFGALDGYPALISELCRKYLGQAVMADQTLKKVIPTHLIALFNKTLPKTPPEGYIPWHQENDGEGDLPVVSFFLGDSCDFLINFKKPKINTDHPLSNPLNLSHRIPIESGDILITCQKIWHAIFNLYPNTSPSFLSPLHGHYNLTFRHTTHLIGDEKRFEQIPENLPKDNPFYKLSTK